MPNEHIILNGHPFADKCMAGNLTILTNLSPPLNLNKRTYLGIVANFAPVQIHEVAYLDSFTQLHLRVYCLHQWALIFHLQLSFSGLSLSIPAVCR